MNEGELMARISDAQIKAEKAMDGVTSHERLCAERYANIQDRLGGIPRLFDKIDSLKMLVYIGMGFCIAIPALIDILHFIKEK